MKIYRKTVGKICRCPFCEKKITIDNAFFTGQNVIGTETENHPFHEKGGYENSYPILSRDGQNTVLGYRWIFEAR